MIPPRSPRPDWLKVRAPSGKRVEEVSGTLARLGLRTVCPRGAVPQRGGVLGGGGGDRDPAGRCVHAGLRLLQRDRRNAGSPDPSEPERVANAAAELSWRHVVVTSVTRDDLPDGGAPHFAAVVRALRREAPGTTVELLVPDFAGNADALRCVVDAAPDILAHNVETVPRLYPVVRKGAGYEPFPRSSPPRRRDAPLPVAEIRDHVGFGETEGEAVAVFRDLFDAGCRSLTVGQYLPPSKGHLPLFEYVSPERFDLFADAARGSASSASVGPLVRSSYYRRVTFRAKHPSPGPRCVLRLGRGPRSPGAPREAR